MSWSSTGSRRFLGNPFYTFALLSDPGRSGWPHLDGQRSAVPTNPSMKTPACNYLEAQSHGFSIRGLRFTKCITTPHARLASGCWLGPTGREFNPLDSDERFLSDGAGFLLS